MTDKPVWIRYIGILRPINGVAVALFVSVSAYIASSVTDVMPLVLMASTAALLMGHTNVVNDLIDEEIDKINQPQRPIPSGAIPRHVAKIYAALLLLIVLALAIWVDTQYVGQWYTTGFMLLCATISDCYNAFLKKYGLLGNLAVAFTDGLIFFYGDSLDGDITSFAWGFGLVTFFLILSREIVKGIMDVEGDRDHGIKTLAVLYGDKKAAWAASVALVLSVLSTIITMIANFSNLTWVIIALCFDIGLLSHVVQLWRDLSPKGAYRVKTGLMMMVNILGVVMILFFLILNPTTL